MSHTFIVAEAGSTHDGELLKARRLVNVAANAGADGVKFQYWSSAERIADRRQKATDYLAIYQRYQMPRAWLEILARDCEAAGVEFLCSTYLPEDIHVVAPFVKRFKISSFELKDRHFLLCHREFKKPIIRSLGMDGGYESAVIVWNSGNASTQDDIYLQCTSAYPCPQDEANLRVLLRWRDTSACVRVGLSDHTRSLLGGAVAVGAGAILLEKHLRLDDTDVGNPDAPAALSPNRFTVYVGNVREADALMGDGVKKIEPAEAAMLKYQVMA